MATENILMAAVKAGGDRQHLHEKIREHSFEAAKNVKEKGLSNDLIDRLKEDPDFASVNEDMEELLDARSFVGRAPEQTEEFLHEEIRPVLERFLELKGTQDTVKV